MSTPAESVPRGSTNTAAFESLQAMVNFVLIQTGRHVKSVTASPGYSPSQLLLKKAIPTALDRFHDSLDELENELSQAQAVLRRDLYNLQENRRKREQAEAAERRRRVAETSAKSTVAPIKEKDVAMPDAPPLKPSKDTAISEMRQENAAGSPERPAPISTTSTSHPDPLFDGTPTSANAQSNVFDLDAMFADEPFSSNTQTMSSRTADGPSNTTGESTSPNTHFNLDEERSAPSLLRGLEDFANSNDATTHPGTELGAHSVDLTNHSSAPRSGEGNDPKAQGADQSKPKSPIAGNNQQPQASDQDTLMDTMQHTTLDDLLDLSNNFEYDNVAEGTEFEDAFTFFGEN